jgi:hypothetical protein
LKKLSEKERFKKLANFPPYEFFDIMEKMAKLTFMDGKERSIPFCSDEKKGGLFIPSEVTVGLEYSVPIAECPSGSITAGAYHTHGTPGQPELSCTDVIVSIKNNFTHMCVGNITSIDYPEEKVFLPEFRAYCLAFDQKHPRIQELAEKMEKKCSQLNRAEEKLIKATISLDVNKWIKAAKKALKIEKEWEKAYEEAASSGLIIESPQGVRHEGLTVRKSIPVIKTYEEVEETGIPLEGIKQGSEQRRFTKFSDELIS